MKFIRTTLQYNKIGMLFKIPDYNALTEQECRDYATDVQGNENIATLYLLSKPSIKFTINTSEKAFKAIAQCFHKLFLNIPGNNVISADHRKQLIDEIVNSSRHVIDISSLYVGMRELGEFNDGEQKVAWVRLYDANTKTVQTGYSISTNVGDNVEKGIYFNVVQVGKEYESLKTPEELYYENR